MNQVKQRWEVKYTWEEDIFDYAIPPVYTWYVDASPKLDGGDVTMYIEDESRIAGCIVHDCQKVNKEDWQRNNLND